MYIIKLHKSHRNIPRIIHQIWSGIEEPLPEFFRELTETWKKHHPDWEYIFWDNERMNSFIQEFYPEYWTSYNAAKYNIQKWDLIRYLILHHFGGMYVDVDYECLESFESLLENNKGCYFSAEAAMHANAMGIGNFFNNALIISIPRHPFVWLIVESAFNEISLERNYPSKLFEVLSTTGPLLLTHLYNNHQDNDDIYIIPSELVAPLNHFDVKKYMAGNNSPSFEIYIQNKLTNALAIHYFAGTWLR